MFKFDGRASGLAIRTIKPEESGGCSDERRREYDRKEKHGGGRGGVFGRDEGQRGATGGGAGLDGG